MTDPRHDLDQLLHAWGERQRLSEREADSIRATIVASPGGATPPSDLPATWWADLSSRVTATVVRATTQPPPLVAGSQVAATAA